jgi:cysteine desulfurase / selenocysteine lyase
VKLDPQKYRPDFPILAERIHGKSLIYFDSAASTQRPRQVMEAMTHLYEHDYGNVHRGVHSLGDRATEHYENARGKVQAFLGAAESYEIIFTAGTTMAINLVARSFGDANLRAGDEVLLLISEHHSNIVPWQQTAARAGAVVKWVGITPEGELDWEDFRQKLTSRTKLVAFAAVSNVLGTIFPVEQIIAAAHAVGAVTLVDAAQAAPHHKIDVQKWDADFVAFSGHKILGPTGIGVLYGKEKLLAAMPPFLGGGSMIDRVTVAGFTPGELPAKFEAGTPPIAEAVGIGAAMDYLEAIGQDAIAAHERELAIKLHTALEAIGDVETYGPAPEKKAGIVSFNLRGVHAQDTAQLLDAKGIAIRAGHHCTMPLHEHLGVSATCRASLYLYNTADEVEQFAEALGQVKRFFHK